MFTRPNTTNSSGSAGLRLWPALLLVVLQGACFFVPPLIAPSTMIHFIGSFVGPMLCALLIVVWWLTFSRVAWVDRLVGVALVVAVSALGWFVADPTMAPPDEPPVALFTFAWPTLVTAGVIGLLLAAPLAWKARRTVAAAFVVAVGVGWSLVRADGMTGGLVPEFSWRWTPTAEELFLAQQKQKGEPATELRDEIPNEAGPGDWPEFRGTQRNGIVEGVTFATDWTQNPPKELWRKRVGPGWSSFAVVGNFAFTQEQRGPKETVVCYHLADGREVWVNEIDARFEETAAGAGPRATPTFVNGRLFTTGGSGVVQCLDAQTGKTIWKRNLTEDTGAPTPTWGFSSSPLVVDDHVIVFAGGTSNQSVIAYNRETGEPAWVNGFGEFGYSSGQLAVIDGVRQVLMASGDGLQSFDPETGKILWEHRWTVPGMAGRVVQPLVLDDGVTVLGTGIGQGTRKLQVNYAGTDGWELEELWTSTRLKPYYNDFVYFDSDLYGFDDKFLCCVDLETGRQRWKERGFGFGQVLLVADMEMLLVISDEGRVALVKASPEFEEVASFQAIKGKTWNHPVIAHGKLLVRNGEEAACYELPGMAGE